MRRDGESGKGGGAATFIQDGMSYMVICVNIDQL